MYSEAQPTKAPYYSTQTATPSIANAYCLSLVLAPREQATVSYFRVGPHLMSIFGMHA